MPTYFHGDHAATFISGLWLRGLHTFDLQRAYQLMLKNATVPHQSAGPSTFGYSLAFLFLATVFVSWWALGLRKYKEYKTKA